MKFNLTISIGVDVCLVHDNKSPASCVAALVNVVQSTTDEYGINCGDSCEME